MLNKFPTQLEKERDKLLKQKTTTGKCYCFSSFHQKWVFCFNDYATRVISTLQASIVPR